MSGKRINAHITIMAALSMTIVLSLISTCIKSASDCYYNTQIKEACMLSVEAAFSSYHNDMLNEYDIFLLENTDRIETKIEKYVEKNLSSCGKDISLLGINVDNIEHMSADCYTLQRTILRVKKDKVQSMECCIKCSQS